MTETDRAAPSLSERLATLSPAKQALLARKLAERRSAAEGQADRIAPREGDGPAPLSYAQELLWLYEQMTPGTAAYHVPIARRLRGEVDEAALERALTQVVAWHEALRTRFDDTGAGPVQTVLPPRPIVLERHDVSALPADEREAATALLLRETAARPFDLAAGSFPRAALVRLDAHDAALLIVVHHVVFDGGSIDVLLRDLGVAYVAARAGTTAEPPVSTLQLADFAVWERRELAGARLEPEIAYWRHALDGAPSGIELPTDFPRPAGTTGPGARFATTLPLATLDAVRRLARAHDATPFMVLTTALQAVLFRWSGQEDLVVGTPISRRDRPGTDRLIGYLANTLALRATVSEDQTFARLLSETRRRTLEAFEHRDVPYELLVRELRGGRPAAEQALFRVLLAMQDMTTGVSTLGDATVQSFGVDVGAAKFDVSFSAAELPNGVRVVAEYRSDLFRAETIARLIAHLDVLVREAAAAPERRVVDLPLMDAGERDCMLHDWAGPRVTYEGGDTLVALLDAQAARTPHAVAVIDDRRALSFAELHARAAHLALALRQRGVGAGTLVGISAERSVELLVGLVAILRAGGAYVPIDPEYPAERVSFMLEDSGVRVLLTQRHLAGALDRGAADVLLIDDPAAPWASDAAAPDAATLASLGTPGAGDPAYMIYTSGSTGRPKGALNAHRGIVNRLQWMQSQYVLSESDVVLQKTPLSFDVSVWELFWPLMTGARLVMAAPGAHRDPAVLARTIETHGVTVCHFVPSMLRAFVATLDGAEAAGRVASLRAVMASGEALAPDLVAAWYRAVPGAGLHNLYGPTECAVDVTHWSCPRSVEPPAVVPIGRPVANTRLYVLDARGALCPIGVPGELYLAGVQVGLGYHARPELTAERFVRDTFAPADEAQDGRMYRTGDRARWLSDGTVEYLGRLDFQVKVRGVRIELGEIETALRSYAGVTDAVAVVRDDEGRGPLLVGYVVPEASLQLDLDALRAHLERRLPVEMRPTALVVLDAMPLSPSGKLDRRALPAPRFEVTTPPVAPRDDVERVIAGVWAEVLQRPIASVHAGFMELGGHSLLATRITGRVSKIFRLTLPLRVFFEDATVAGVARAVVAHEPKAGQAALIARLFLKAQQMTVEEREQLRRDDGRPDKLTVSS